MPQSSRATYQFSCEYSACGDSGLHSQPIYSSYHAYVSDAHRRENRKWGNVPRLLRLYSYYQGRFCFGFSTMKQWAQKPLARLRITAELSRLTAEFEQPGLCCWYGNVSNRAAVLSCGSGMCGNACEAEGTELAFPFRIAVSPNCMTKTTVYSRQRANYWSWNTALLPTEERCTSVLWLITQWVWSRSRLLSSAIEWDTCLQGTRDCKVNMYPFDPNCARYKLHGFEKDRIQPIALHLMTSIPSECSCAVEYMNGRKDTLLSILCSIHLGRQSRISAFTAMLTQARLHRWPLSNSYVWECVPLFM